MLFEEESDFKREYKKLKKKFLSLDEDISSFKKILKVYPKGRGEKHWNILSENESKYILKSRLFCRYLKRKSLRIIYLYKKEEDKIIFIEIYFKGNKEVE
ncbi:hypothetical protein ACFLY7_01170, partial [Patescibacteria group bacterium]